jgi:hypothetical protein
VHTSSYLCARRIITDPTDSQLQRCVWNPTSALRLKLGLSSASNEFSIMVNEMTEKEIGGSVLWYIVSIDSRTL